MGNRVFPWAEQGGGVISSDTPRRRAISPWVEGMAFAFGAFVIFHLALGAWPASMDTSGMASDAADATRGLGAASGLYAPADFWSTGAAVSLGSGSEENTDAEFEDADLSPYGLSPYIDGSLNGDYGTPFDETSVGEARQNYQNGSLRISIPVIKYDAPIYGGTDEKSLNKGPSLFELSPLPGFGDRNVSIAGHRNGVRNGKITRIMFYDLDKLSEGDYIYLYDKRKVFRYRFESSEVVEDDDWSITESRGYSCVTLVTCTPVGVADHRLAVRGVLEGVYQSAEGQKPDGKSLPASGFLCGKSTRVT